MVIIPWGNPAYQNKQDNQVIPSPGWYILESRGTFKPLVIALRCPKLDRIKDKMYVFTGVESPTVSKECSPWKDRSWNTGGWLQRNTFTAWQLWAEGGGCVFTKKPDHQSQELSNTFLCVQAVPTESFPTSDPEIQWCPPVFWVRKWLTQLCRNCR